MDAPFGAPAGLVQRLSRSEVRTADLVAAVERLRGAMAVPGLQLGVVQGLGRASMLLVEEDGRRFRVPLGELAGEMNRAHVRSTPDGVAAALRSWLDRRPVTDEAAAEAGIAVLEWADPRQSVLGWRVVLLRGDAIAPWRPSRSTTLPRGHQIRSAALGRSAAVPADLHVEGPVGLWSHPGTPGIDTAVLVRPEELIVQMAAAGLPLRDAHVVVSPRRPVACADAGVARRLAAEATEGSVTMPCRELADLGWA